MDIVLCRNVLMYFDEEHVNRVLTGVYESLVDGGWLVLSATEAFPQVISGLKSLDRVGGAGSSVYRKSSAPAPPVPREWMDRPPFGARPEEAHVPYHRRRLSPHSPSELARLARHYANQGSLDRAAKWCTDAIAADRTDPAHHYLLATIQQEQGRLQEAADSLRRAIYLDPDFIVAHFALGNLARERGLADEAERHFRNARRLLARLDTEESVPASEGITAGRLSEIIAATEGGELR